MKLEGKVAVVTGGAHGIGAALCRRFAAEGARAVVVADRDARGAEAVAREVKGLAVPTDVTREEDLNALVARATEAHGAIDLFCSNAGAAIGGGIDAPDEDWHRAWCLHVMAHVFAARAVLPGMLARGGGYLLQTASAAGLLSNIGAAPYTATKHAAVGFAEWLAITYGDRGIKVSCLCPQAVSTGLAFAKQDDVANQAALAAGPLLDPDAVAASVIEGLAAERFLILPHPDVATYVKKKAEDPDRWLGNMRKMQAKLTSGRREGGS